ncbi:helix-turn-helix domain-containing protein [Microbacterium sediminicola]|uniref:Helix-turn-helix domain-containing protein n=1 Tax=Microbacterium sediminicola TaxID=415210 RepID=A0ABP4U2A1_9MICO
MNSAGAVEKTEADFDEQALGAHIRRLRMAQQISLRKLAAEADVSVSFLSQVERGTASPSIASLMRIAKALGQTIGNLFEARTDNWLVRAGEAPRLVHPNREWDEELLTPREFTKLQVIRSVLAVGGSTGDEYLSYGPSETSMIIQSGEVDVTIGGETHRLRAGDCLSYDPSTQHSISNAADVPCVILFSSSAAVY